MSIQKNLKPLHLNCISFKDEQWTTDLTMKHKIIKLPEKKGAHLCDFGFDNEFLDITSKTWSIKEKMINHTFFKMKNVGSSIDTIKRMKRQSTDWENNLQVTHLTNNLYQDCIKKSYNSIIGKQTTQLEKWAEYLNSHFITMWAKKPRKTIFKSSRFSRRLTLISWARGHVISKIDSGFIWRLSIVASDLSVVLIVLVLVNLARVDFFCALFRLLKPPNKNSNVGENMPWKFNFPYMLLSSCPKP